MASQVNCPAGRSAVVLLVSLFGCLFCVGECRFSAFRASRVQPDGVAEEQWFTQKLDHFNGADRREWKQVSVNLGNLGVWIIKFQITVDKQNV